MTDVDEIMAVMHEAKNDKEHPDWFVSDDEEYVRTHIETVVRLQRKHT